jgi:DNA-binding PucR family transcriptional regulator
MITTNDFNKNKLFYSQLAIYICKKLNYVIKYNVKQEIVFVDDSYDTVFEIIIEYETGEVKVYDVDGYCVSINDDVLDVLTRFIGYARD